MPDRQPIGATPEVLNKILDRRPVLWVGAGTSVAAGHPSTGALVQAMVAAADDPLDAAQPFEQVADAFVASLGAGALGDLLQAQLGGSLPLTDVHRAIARAAGDGKLAAIVTTNYDDLLERALGEAGVRYVFQRQEDNAVVVDPAAEVRLLKLHGSRDDWAEVILSGESYATFGRRYPFLERQLHVLLRQHPLLFVGCSLQDPRIVDWLAGLDDGAARGLKPWRALITERAWQAAVAARPGLLRAPLRPVVLDDHDHLPRLWQEAVPERAAAGEMVIELAVGAGALEARLDGGATWQPVSPLEDGDFLATLELLRDHGTRPLPADDHGMLAPAPAGVAALLCQQAAEVGTRLAGMLDGTALERLAALEAAARAGTPALLRLRVAVAAGGDAAVADRLLALPWELLRVDGRFPVEQYTVDVVREAVVPHLGGLAAPEGPLEVVATVAAPVDQPAVDHEAEMFRLWQALGAADEGRLHVADLGTLDDLAAAVKQHRPPVVHFTGHGTPGALVFEDEAAHGVAVPVDEVVKRLHAEGVPLPRLIYLSACHGTSLGTAAARPGVREGERMVDAAAVATQPSTAAALHRGGFAQVVGYFGPVGDIQATRTAAAFYAALARGETARAALRAARELASRPLPLGDGWGVYPLGWAQLALYHRGADVATALPSGGGAVLPEAPTARVFVRLDQTGGVERVERRHDVPLVGVQQLRHGFIGRRAPRAQAIRRWRQGQRVLVVQGLGGLGKTALCAELLRVLPAPRVLALDGRYAGAQADPLAGLWREVQAARGDAAWSQLLAQLQQNGLGPEALAGALAELARLEGGLIVYLDDAESLQQELAEAEGLGRWRSEALRTWWRLLVVAAERGSFGVVASSRFRPEGTPEAGVLNLEPMSSWEIVRLMTWMPTLRRLPHADRAWLAEQIEGHPRTVEWLEVLAAEAAKPLTTPTGRFTGSWRAAVLVPKLREAGEKVDADLLLGQVWQALDDDAREHLGRTSVLTKPVPWEAVLHLQPAGAQESGLRLVAAGLLSPFQSLDPEDPWWQPHRLVSEMVGRQWQGDPATAHRQVGHWFRDRFEAGRKVLDAQRAVEHLCAGGDGDGAFPTAERLAQHLRDAGRYREGLGWVDRVFEAGVTGPRLGMALMGQVQLLRLAGSLPADGEARLLRALDLVEHKNRGDVLYQLGSYCRTLGQLPKAAEYLTRTVEFEIEDKGEQSRDVATSLHQLAVVLQAQGDLDGARRHLERSLAIQALVFGTEDHPEVAASLHELAAVLRAQGDLDGARRHLERSLAIKALVFGTEDHPSVAASLHALAAVLQAQGDPDGARRHLERSLEIKEKVYGTREHYLTAISEENLGLLLVESGDVEAGMKLLGHAYGVFQRQLGPDHPFTRGLAQWFEQQGGTPAPC